MSIYSACVQKLVAKDSLYRLFMNMDESTIQRLFAYSIFVDIHKTREKKMSKQKNNMRNIKRILKLKLLRMNDSKASLLRINFTM